MAFDYYQRLKPWQQRVYDQSDQLTEIPLKVSAECKQTVTDLRDALSAENRRQTQSSTMKLVATVCSELGCRSPVIKVLSVRPSDDYEELHGLYEYGDEDTPLITVWMRTAQHRRVVAVRSYLRTVLHELCHHLDYEHFKLKDSFHTEGFYKRESSLFKQLTRSVELPRASTGGRKSNKTINADQPARSSGSNTAAKGQKTIHDAGDDASPVYIEDNRDWS